MEAIVATTSKPRESYRWFTVWSTAIHGVASVEFDVVAIVGAEKSSPTAPLNPLRDAPPLISGANSPLRFREKQEKR